MVGHFLLGFGWLGGTWADLEKGYRWIAESVEPLTASQDAAVGWVFDFYALAFPYPLVAGGLVLSVAWPALLAFYWSVRPGGRML